jgi:hypothetical protein
MSLLQTVLLIYFSLSLLTTLVLFAACVAARRADDILGNGFNVDQCQQLATSEPRLMQTQPLLQAQPVVAQRR